MCVFLPNYSNVNTRDMGIFSVFKVLNKEKQISKFSHLRMVLSRCYLQDCCYALCRRRVALLCVMQCMHNDAFLDAL